MPKERSKQQLSRTLNARKSEGTVIGSKKSSKYVFVEDDDYGVYEIECVKYCQKGIMVTTQKAEAFFFNYESDIGHYFCQSSSLAHKYEVYVTEEGTDVVSVGNTTYNYHGSAWYAEEGSYDSQEQPE